MITTAFTTPIAIVGVILGFIGLAILLFNVIPVQIRESMNTRNYALIRRTLPILTSLLVVVGSPTLAYYAYRLIHFDTVNPMADLIRFAVGFILFIYGIAWLLIYKKG